MLYMLYADVKHLIAAQAITLIAKELQTLYKDEFKEPAGDCGPCRIITVFGLSC